MVLQFQLASGARAASNRDGASVRQTLRQINRGEFDNVGLRPELRDALRAASARAGAVAIDAGLRAYMIRIYNYMALGVALTGVVALASRFQRRRRDQCGLAAITGLTPFGQALFGSPLTWR